MLPMLNRFCIGFLAAALLSAQAAAVEDDAADWANEGRWPRSAQAVELTPEKQALKARRLQDIGDSKQAAEQYRRLADVYSESDQAEEGLVRAARN